MGSRDCPPQKNNHTGSSPATVTVRFIDLCDLVTVLIIMGAKKKSCDAVDQNPWGEDVRSIGWQNTAI